MRFSFVRKRNTLNLDNEAESTHITRLTAALFFTQKWFTKQLLWRVFRLMGDKPNNGNGSCVGFAPSFPLICKTRQSQNSIIIFCYIIIYKHKCQDTNTNVKKKRNRKRGFKNDILLFLTANTCTPFL